jgi:hypothetical protein
MGNDYQLKKIYADILKGKISKDIKTPRSLKEAYNYVKPFVNITEGIAELHDAEIKYNQVIAKVLFGTKEDVNKIPLPVGDYKIGINFTITKEDKEIYSKLYPIAPPKQEVDDDVMIGSKGSGNGEIALYWLLSKNHTVKDMRGSDNPDLLIDGSIGVEVKAYDSKKIGLGRFGNQYANRKLLSIIFGLKALLGAITIGQDGGKGRTQRQAPSLDTFKKEELIQSFKILLDFDNNNDLKQIAHKYSPIDMIYQQISLVVNGLDLQHGQFTAEQGAAEIIKLLLITKLTKKPGFGGYLANIDSNGQCIFHLVNEDKIKKLDSNIILDNVNANGAGLYVQPDNIFVK